MASIIYQIRKEEILDKKEIDIFSLYEKPRLNCMIMCVYMCLCLCVYIDHETSEYVLGSREEKKSAPKRRGKEKRIM